MKIRIIGIFLITLTQLYCYCQNNDTTIFLKVDSIPKFYYSECNDNANCIKLYLKRHQSWPTDDDIIAIVYIQCIIEKDGKLTNFKIFRGFDERYEKASIDILKSMPLWKPGEIGDKAVRTQIIIPVEWSFLDTH
jgi:periplasmic protein TonB